MAAETSQKPIHSLILDTGPLIKNAVSSSTLINSAEELFTTPAIISEIRDEATRSRVQTTLMPFLKVRTPSPASYDAVIAFSKKTGDHAVLSRQDLGILALAYEVHCERNGGPWGLRDAPKQPLKMKPGTEHRAKEPEHLEEQGGLGDQKEPSDEVKPSEAQQEDDLSGFTEVSKKKKNSKQGPRKDRGNAKHNQQREEQERQQQARAPESDEQSPAEQQDTSIATEVSQGPTVDLPTNEGVTERTVESESSTEATATRGHVGEEQQTHEQQAGEQSIGEADAAQPSTGTVSSSLEPAPQETETTSEQLASGLSALNMTTPPSPPVTDDDDSDGDWITPSNLNSRQAADSGTITVPQEQIDVATMTTDFAMQNVLLQMNLHLLSTNMQRIKKLVSKVLRCHACFATVKQMDKQFCPRCGGATLKRVNCSINSRGEFRLHLAKNYQFNKRGDKYSIPKPIAGTANTKWSGIGGGQGGWGRDLILAEDQKEFTKKIEEDRRAKGARDLMDDDYLPGILTGDRSAGRAGGRVKVGAGKNVNSKKRG
ncbi:Nin one binding Zn-ribbon like-domain-containing protein [Phaeosphaeria sp. MPI-PUGE-AT-0046c]|nr:Nin one binding Zn-ribbon like-domain-containing protein [Phaeosphaeria sp. MPI-PUGE-AT-0046c]